MVWMATVAREMGATSAGAGAADGARSGDERPRRAIGEWERRGAKPRKREVRLQKRRRGGKQREIKAEKPAEKEIKPENSNANTQGIIQSWVEGGNESQRRRAEPVGVAFCLRTRGGEFWGVRGQRSARPP